MVTSQSETQNYWYLSEGEWNKGQGSANIQVFYNLWRVKHQIRDCFDKLIWSSDTCRWYGWVALARSLCYSTFPVDSKFLCSFVSLTTSVICLGWTLGWTRRPVSEVCKFCGDGCAARMRCVLRLTNKQTKTKAMLGGGWGKAAQKAKNGV